CRSCRWWREARLSRRHCEERSDEAIQRLFADTFLDCFASLAMPLSRLLPQILLHLRDQPVAQFGPLQAVGDVGAEEAGLGAAIMALALELDAVEFLRLGEADHGVGELDLAAGAALLGLQDLEDLRLENVAAGD